MRVRRYGIFCKRRKQSWLGVSLRMWQADIARVAGEGLLQNLLHWACEWVWSFFSQRGDSSLSLLNVFRAKVTVSRQRSTSPMGHLKDILKEWHSTVSPLFTPADPACWACGDTSWLFLVLCSRRAHYWALPGLFHQPEAAWTETQSASKQSTSLFTANYFPESQALRTKWKNFW